MNDEWLDEAFSRIAAYNYTTTYCRFQFQKEGCDVRVSPERESQYKLYVEKCKV